MKVDRLTPMTDITVRSPIWNNGNRVVGIADYRLKTDLCRIEITYVRKDGVRSFPDTYVMASSKIRTYPTMTVAGGVLLYLVPLSDLEVLEEA